ncbi:tetrapyrrole methylase family protein/MazG family protein [Alkalihalobacillus xiaoxiensis]|uniref:Tetrapyrrole methylase family protein/MazG family protein n=1 Tax=Shouchella xiaoxiensis TaxID=766895 RepID=A0ABS2T0I3_9BACI|nr:nucleoside triphosphate pyrophosphohydrolase [Shouchella xiaoxiensis]MBM7841297.1 tetrapyrrole methylase family protein/MazG family protein [Shouchella xiaoxiensis]
MGRIQVVGLGAGELAQLPLGIYRELKGARSLYVRTVDHPVLKELKEEGITFQSFDSVYEQHQSFEEVYDAIVNQLIELAAIEDVLYAVPGHPFVAEKTVQLLKERVEGTDIELKIVGGASFLDQMYTTLGIDPIEGCQIVDGTALTADEIQIRHHVIVVQVYDAMIASEVKLTLMEKLPDDYEVTIVTAAGTSSEVVQKVKLYELDRYTKLNNLTAVYVPPVKEAELLERDFSHLRRIIETLRGPGGCPWDQKQTHQSLKRYLLEETYEVFEAINEDDDEHLAEELGDVLLQVLLHAQIGEEEGFFTIDDVVAGLAQKMIRRHPHVFGNKDVSNEQEVLKNWQEIKKEEKPQQVVSEVLSKLTSEASILAVAEKLQKEAAAIGFEYAQIEDVWAKLEEETKEVKEASLDSLEEEYGDLLLTVVSLGRFYKVSPGVALHYAVQKFRNRFAFMEEQARHNGTVLSNSDFDQLNKWWKEAKQEEE